jgi:hypothetical protein
MKRLLTTTAILLSLFSAANAANTTEYELFCTPMQLVNAKPDSDPIQLIKIRVRIGDSIDLSVLHISHEGKTYDRWKQYQFDYDQKGKSGQHIWYGKRDKNLIAMQIFPPEKDDVIPDDWIYQEHILKDPKGKPELVTRARCSSKKAD